MAEDMIERAARSTFLVGRDWDDPASFDAAPDYGKDVYRDYARAALLAALDPEDEALVERVAHEYADPFSGYADPSLAKRIIATLRTLAQGEQPVRSDMREKD